MSTSTHSQSSIFETALLQYKLLGEDIQYNSTKLWLFRTITCAVLLVISILIFLQYFHAEKELYAQIAESNIVILHTFLKYISFIYYKLDVEILIYSAANKFWNPEDMDWHASVSYNKLYEATEYILRIMQVVAYMTIVLFMMRPLLNRESVTPFDVWQFDDSFITSALILILQFYTFYIMYSAMFGYNILYMTFCMHIIMQVRLLKYKLQHFSVKDVKSSHEEITECVKYHQFLLRIVGHIKQIYSMMLLFHYFTTLTGSCVELYKSVVVKAGMSYTIVNYLFTAVVFCEFALFTFTAEQVTFELSDISNSIYLSRWYEDIHKNTREGLFLIMLVCQRQQYFIAGGIIPINIATFQSVFRKSISFYAVLRNFLND